MANHKKKSSFTVTFDRVKEMKHMSRTIFMGVDTKQKPFKDKSKYCRKEKHSKIFA
jgi:hypothetical protein